MTRVLELRDQYRCHRRISIYITIYFYIKKNYYIIIYNIRYSFLDKNETTWFFSQDFVI